MGHGLSASDWQTGAVTDCASTTSLQRELLVLVVEDAPVLSRSIGFLCDYLGIHLETVSGHADLEAVLRSRRPMAVMSMIDTPAQDGCHVLKTIAGYDRTLPVMLVTGNDPALLGAVEAVEEIWQLGRLSKMTGIPGVGDLVEFLFSASRRSDSTLIPA
jgi:CheY-like chemotaxis protein